MNIYTIAMLFSITTFTLSTVLTPGPNNVMLLSSGLTFGYKRTLPHIFGIMIGFPIMVIVVGLGLDTIFNSFPTIFLTLKIVGSIYLFWMAYKISQNDGDIQIDKKQKPFNFFQAVLFQWINPKAWIMAITAISVFVTPQKDTILQVLIIAFIYFLSGIISTNFWAIGGVVLKKLISNKKYIKIFNQIMAFILVCSTASFIF